ncbi:MAG: hypothetical protein WBW92_08630, partial [Rhodanobacteraceae bacterium]
MIAVDSSDNESADSVIALAHVFGIDMEQPYTPTEKVTVDLAGKSARAGDIDLHVESDLGAIESQPGPTSIDGSLALSGQSLELGSNHFNVRVTDSDGNRSRPADLWIDRSSAPAVPTGLDATVMDHDVALHWNANSEPDLLGYRIFRNGNPVNADAPLVEAITPSAEYGYGIDSIVDGDLQTAWSIRGVFGAPDQGGEDPAIEMTWSAPRIITLLRLSWIDVASATGNLDLYAWSGHAWVGVAKVRTAAQDRTSLVLERPYRTTRLRLVLHGAVQSGEEHELQLAEVELLQRPLHAPTSLNETLLDGSYQYQLSAVNDRALESALSDAVAVSVGDSVGPDPVLLSGNVVGNDAHLDWTPSGSPDVARYDLLRNGNLVATVTAQDELTYQDTNLMLGTYAYSVIAYDAFDNASAESNVVNLTIVGTGPGIPVGLAVTAPAAGSALDVAWQPSEGSPAVSYIVRRAELESGPFDVIAESAETSLRDAPLSNGSTYFYTVEAVDAAGNLSGPSEVVSGTPQDRVAPAAPVLTFPTVAQFPLSVDSTTTSVCGLSEPVAQLLLDRDGSEQGSTAATAENTVGSWQVHDANEAIRFAPDGNRYAYEDWNGQLKVVESDTSMQIVSRNYVQYPQWAARGTTLYYLDEAAGEINRWSAGGTSAQIPMQITSVQAVAVDPTEQVIAVAGEYSADAGVPVDAVWLMNADGAGEPQAVASIDPNQLVPDQPLLWSPDGSQLLLVSDDGAAHLVDPRSATVKATFALDPEVSPAWSSDSRSIAFMAGDDLKLYSAVTGNQLLLKQLAASYSRALAWSPAGDQLAILGDDNLDIVSAANGVSALPVPVINYDYLDKLTWTASGRLFASNGYDVLQFDPEGWFCTDQMPLAPGSNHFSANALDAAGNRSLSSAAIEIDTSGEDLPDLVVDDADIFFLPASGGTGQSYAALVT